MGGSRWRTVLDYACALALACVALLVFELRDLEPARGSAALAGTLAVLLASWRGGTGPGLLATAVIVAWAFRAGPAPWRSARLVMALANGVLISLVVGSFRTAWRRAHAAAESLREGEQRYRRIVETADEGIWLLDVDGRATFVNARGAAMLGLEPEEVVGHTLLGYAESAGGAHTGEAESDSLDVTAARALAELREGRSAQFDLRLRRKDDSTLWARVSASPVMEQGEFRGALAMLADVTERVAVSTALRRSEARFRRLSESGMIGVAMIDLDGRVREANAEFLRIAGQTRVDLEKGRVNWLAMTPPEYGEQDRRHVAELRATGVAAPVVKEYLGRGGGRVAVLVGTARMEGPRQDGEAECVSFVLDVSARRRAEEAMRLLAEAGKVLGAPLGERSRPDALLAGLARLAVPRLCDLCVVEARDDETPGDTRVVAAQPGFPAPFPRALADGVESPAARAFRTGRSVLVSDLAQSSTLEWRESFRAMGVRSLMAVPLLSRGRCLAVATFASRLPRRNHDAEDLALAEELTHRAALALDNARLYDEAQEALRRRDEVQAIAEALLQAAPVGVAFFDTELRYVRINEELATLNEVPVEAHLGRTIAEVLPCVAPGVEPFLRSVLETGMPVLNQEVSIPRPEGLTHWLANYYPVRGSDGRAIGVGVTLSDVTTVRRAEEGLRFLAEASVQLGSSLDYHATLNAVANLAIPTLADWCVIDVVEADGVPRRVALAHRPRDARDPLETFASRYAPDRDWPFGPAHVIRTGRSELVSSLVEAVETGTLDASLVEVIRALDLRSYLCTPLVARGGVLGALTLVSAESGRRFGPADLALADDLARRAGQAVDNARLFSEALQARLEAESASNAKDRFLAALSHELRTPLTPVLVGVTALLEDPDLPASVRPVLDVTRRNVALEARLIDDLLDVTRIAQGKLRLDRACVDAHGLIHQAVEICRDEIASAGLSLEFDLGAEQRHILGDPARVQQILWNLVKNAVKFTPPGGRVRVGSRNEPRAERRPSLVIEVEDTGIGIEPDVLPRIFNAFEQGDVPLTRQFGGLGLGLANSRSLAEAHGGSLTARSEGNGQGTRFRLEIPTTSAPSPRGERRTHPTNGDDPDRARHATFRILLAEDNADTLRIMARLLRHRGHQVTTADCMTAALDAAQSEGPFDLVISDIGLPDGSGLELIAQLRRARPMPAIALSGYGTEDDLRKSREAGFLTHLTKPVDFSTLEQAIQRALDPRSSASHG